MNASDTYFYLEILWTEEEEWGSYGPFETDDELTEFYDDFVEQEGVFPKDIRIREVTETVIRHPDPWAYAGRHKE